MSERFSSLSPESSDDDSDLEKDTSKTTARKKGRELGGVIPDGEKSAGKQGERKEVAEKSIPLLDKLLKEEREAKSSDASPEKKPKQSEEVAAADQEQLTTNEEQIAEALANEETIDLHSVPEEHDSAIIERAVDMAEKQPVAEEAASEQQEPLSTQTTEAAQEPPAEELAEAPAEESQELPLESPAPETATESNEAESTEEEDPGKAPATATSSQSSTHAAGGSTATPTGQQGSGGGGQPPVTPVPPPRRTPLPRRFQRPQPVPGPNIYTAPTAVNTVGNTIASAAAPNILNSARSNEDLQAYAYRRGRNRGLVAGVIVGGGIEHIRHKRREKKMTREFAKKRQEQVKKIETIQQNHAREIESAAIREETKLQEAARLQEAAKVRNEAKIREMAAEKDRANARAASGLAVEANHAARTQSLEERTRQRAEIQREIEKKLAAEQKAKEKARITQKLEEKAQAMEQEEQAKLAEGHRIERSAWHNIEVDSHGKAAEETSFEYGHEYYQERAKETAPRTKQVKKHIDEATGEVALVAAVLSEGGESRVGGGTQPQSTYAPRQPQSPAFQQRNSSFAPRPLRQQAHASQPAQRTLLQTVTSPPTTVRGTIGWSIALVIILAIIGIVLL
ncbi:hypothetical protein CSA80_03385 [Candidatus Saccharibacteria bacterium]|nr:MAG: hypothetical protein CSA80_03385 [Candidatus Saccharibacteria bacterium]